MIAVQRRPMLVPRGDVDLGEPLAGPSRLATQPGITSPIPVLAPIAQRKATTKPELQTIAGLPDSPDSAETIRPKSASRSRTPSRPPSRVDKRFKCGHDGCDKAYFKPSRLAEHELTHTGEYRSDNYMKRPHTCPNCDQAYLRASHLTAHMRTHLPPSAREHHCTYEGCDKAFWTATHLRRHQAMHEQAVVYPCEHCSSTFHKANHLRDHIALTHLPAGTKSFQCSHDGCSASFEFRQKLKAHEKTHDASRYTCSHPSHDTRPCFPTWTALQSHLHTAHPPECPHTECGGRTFPNLQRLKDHLKVHAHRAEDIASAGGDDDDDDGDAVNDVDDRGGEAEGAEEIDELTLMKRKRRRSSTATLGAEGGVKSKLARLEGGQAGKEWSCKEDDCNKIFKTKFALKNHRRTAHPLPTEVKKVHKCPIATCDKAYAHACNLRDHLSTHSNLPSPALRPTFAAIEGNRPESDLMFGTEKRRYGCPFNHIRQNRTQHLPDSRSDASTTQTHPSFDCYARFWRVYDVRRHLKAEHGAELEDGEVRELLALVDRGHGQDQSASADANADADAAAGEHAGTASKDAGHPSWDPVSRQAEAVAAMAWEALPHGMADT